MTTAQALRILTTYADMDGSLMDVVEAVEDAIQRLSNVPQEVREAYAIVVDELPSMYGMAE